MLHSGHLLLQLLLIRLLLRLLRLLSSLLLRGGLLRR
jgi:hypothetical protein